MLRGTWETSAAVAVIVTLALTPLMQRIALATGFLDHPVDRKSHGSPMPYLGGLAIAAGTVSGLLFGSPGLESKDLLILGGVISVCLVGLLDDRRNVSPWLRLATQAGVAFAAVLAGVRTGIAGTEAVDIALTVIWIVAITNAFNLLDNMDGLSGGIAFVAAAGCAVAAVHNGQLVIGSLAAALAGACWGFLAYNIRPAAIYMGDAGSLFLGCCAAVVTLEVDSANGGLDGAVAAALFCAVPMLDISTVFVSRPRHGRRIMTGGKDHLSHRLSARGLSVGQAVFVLVAAHASLVALGCLVATGQAQSGIAIVFGVPVIVAVAIATWGVAVYDVELAPDAPTSGDENCRHSSGFGHKSLALRTGTGGESSTSPGREHA